MNEAHNLATPYQQKLTWASLLASTYSLYQKQFWSFWRLAMPIALLAFLFTQGQRTLIHSLFDRLIGGHSNPRRILDSPLYLLIIAIWGYIDGAVYWFLSTILFAALACKLGQRGLSMDEVPLSDAYTGVRRRAKVLFIFAILSWTPFWLARGLAGFCGWKLADLLRIRLDSLAGLAVFSLPLLIIAALFCRIALAVPELMNEERVSVREALRRSFHTTENWGLFFMFFLEIGRAHV